MNVCIVNPFPTTFSGGVESFIKSLKEGLENRGTHVEVLSLSESEMRFIPRSARVTMSLALIPKLLRRKNEFDVIHANAWNSFVLRFVWGKPTVATAHGTVSGLMSWMGNDAPYPSRVYSYLVTKNLEKVGFRSAKRIAAVSQFTKDELVHSYGIESGKIDVNYIGIDENKYKKVRTDMRQQFDCDSLLLFIGRLTRQKGVDLLLRAVAMLKGRKLNLIIAGEGPEKQNLELLAKQLGLKGKVHFMGNVSDEKKMELYSATDACVFPSLWESFGVVLLEAMACEAPIVTTDAGSIPEIIEDCGVVTMAKNLESLAGGIDRMISDSALREAFRIRARERFLSKFTAQKMCDAYLELYKKII